MRSATPRLALIAALAGAVTAYQPLRAVEAAPAPAGSAPPGPSASAAAPAGHGVPVSAYAWPAEASPEPREEDWAGATELEVAPAKDPGGSLVLVCAQRALGAWLRISCTPPPGSSHLGAVWGLAGDVAKVKGSFSLLSGLEGYKKPPTSTKEDLERKMGDAVTITLPLTPGTAALLRIDRISWDEEWDWSGVVASPGMLVDVSWALGEAHPTILYR